jgi:hypothetical protein
MKYVQADGFPTTFSLTDAAAITEVSVTRLRNYIARDILKHVGQIPLAGQERRFAVWGLYEIGLISALAESSYTLEQAAKVVHAAFNDSLTAGYLAYSHEHPETVRPFTEAGLKSHDPFHSIEAMPDYWLKGFWTHRALTNPAIWVFGRLMGTMSFGPRVAKGWHDVPAVAIELQKEIYSTITPAIPDETTGGRSQRPAKINENHPSAHSGLKVLGLLNVTAVLTAIDAAVERHLAASAALASPSAASLAGTTIS